MLSVMAVKGKKVLKTQFATNEACIIITVLDNALGKVITFQKIFQSEMVGYINMLFFLKSSFSHEILEIHPQKF